jgi:hypothetical protein
MTHAAMHAALKDANTWQGVKDTPNHAYGQLHGHVAIRNYLLAGNSTFTLVSRETGRRYTYRVKSAAKDRNQNWSVNNQDRNIFFVSVLTGSDNDSSYRYMGELRRVEPSGHAFRYVHGRKSILQESAMSIKAFKWFIGQLESHREFEEQLEFWHEGRCGRCGRKLTVPESIASGMGPECAGKE